jgi:hypothetical protein
MNRDPAGAVNVVAVKSMVAGVYTPDVPNGKVKVPLLSKYFLTSPELFARIIAEADGVPVTEAVTPKSRLYVPIEIRPLFRINDPFTVVVV